MSYIIFDSTTGKILAEANENQDINLMMSYWPDSDFIKNPNEKNIFTKLNNIAWSVNPQTRELISA